MNPKLALVQHPMYLLIQEDTQCAERTPPWGAPSVDVYIERLRRNLKTIRETPSLKFGYEWSAIELEMLAEHDPTVFKEMCALVAEGKCTFYNGTYSQPHLQILSSEANYRQFEYGARVYSELCGAHVHTYAHQESSVHEQLPQLLDAFGIPYVTMPEFMSTLVTQGEYELLYHRDFGPLLVEGQGLVDWKGIDGSSVSLYIHQKPRMPLKTWLEYQEMLGLQHSPSIFLQIPDLIEIDDQWMSEHEGVEFVTLEEALRDEAARATDRPTVRFFTNWSYAEGIRAEELSRQNTMAERAALAAEALDAMAVVLTGREPVFTHDIWKKILLTQHHDVYCFCGPEIRDKSVRWLTEAQSDAEAIANEAAAAIVTRIPDSGDGTAVAVFGLSPNPTSGLVKVVVASDQGVVIDPNGKTVASSRSKLVSGETEVEFVAETAGLGYTMFTIHQDADPIPVARDLTAPLTFENQEYRVVVEPDGTLSSLTVGAGATELLGGRANALRATDSSSIERGEKEPPKQLGQGMGARGRSEWFSEGVGPDLYWKAGRSVVRETSIGTHIVVSGALAPNARADLAVRLYHELPFISVRWEFDFDYCSIGTFYDDQSKLRVQVPLSYEGSVFHDIPFGYVESKRERPFFPTTWTDISDSTKGLAYLHRGTPKHWVVGTTLENLLAWGEHTDAIGNRLGKSMWGKSFDQRLHGRHAIEFGLYPHAGAMRVDDVSRVARSYGGVHRAYLVPSHGRGLPNSATVLALGDPAIVATSVKSSSAGMVSCRAYSIAEGPAAPVIRSDYLESQGLTNLKGETVEALEPFQIGSLTMRTIGSAGTA